jgi:hypothetical protein
MRNSKSTKIGLPQSQKGKRMEEGVLSTQRAVETIRK